MIINKMNIPFILFLCAFIGNAFPINRGLVNQGNSCYMNAALQCITHVQPFVEYLKANQAMFIPKGNQQVIQFINLLKNIRDTTGQHDPSKIAAFSPAAFYNLSFVGNQYSQQDSSEFLIPLLDAINEVDSQPSIIQKTFGFKQVSRLTCPKCAHTSDSVEEILDLNTLNVKSLKNSLELPLPVGNSLLKIDDLLKDYFTQEILDDANRWQCSKCLQYVNATKQLLLQNAPDFLIVTLKRFPAPHQKNIRPVSFPRYNLNLKEFVAGNQDTFYELIGIDIHHGNAGGGHYFAYCKDFENGQWYQLNDSSVSFANNAIDDIVNQKIEAGSPYILFYQRQAALMLEPKPVQPIAPKPGPLQPPKPLPQKPATWPIIDDDFAKQLATLQLTTDEKKASLRIRISQNPEYYFAKTQDGKSPIHLFVNFLKKILDQKSDLDLLQNGYSLDNNLYKKNITVQELSKELQPKTYFEYLEFLVENFDVNAQLPDSYETVLHVLIKDSYLRADLDRNDLGYQFQDILLKFFVQKTNLNLQDKDGKTPFYLLVENLSSDETDKTENFIYTLFFKYHLHLDIPTYNRRTILHSLLSKNKINNPFRMGEDVISNILTLFLRAKKENFSSYTTDPKKGLCELIKTQDNYGKTPLHYALENEHLEAAKALLTVLFRNKEANNAFFKLTSNSYGDSPGKSIQNLIDDKHPILNQFIAQLKIDNPDQQEDKVIDEKAIESIFGKILQELFQNTALAERIKKLAEDGTLKKFEDEVTKEIQQKRVTKPPEQTEVIELIKQKITQSLAQPQDPLKEKLSLLKQRLIILKTKLGQLKNSLKLLKKRLLQTGTSK